MQIGWEHELALIATNHGGNIKQALEPGYFQSATFVLQNASCAHTGGQIGSIYPGTDGVELEGDSNPRPVS